MNKEIKEIYIGNRKLYVTKQLNDEEFDVKCDMCGYVEARFNTSGKLYCKKCVKLEFFM